MWRDAEVVFSGDTIEFVGQGFNGHIDVSIDYGQGLWEGDRLSAHARTAMRHRCPCGRGPLQDLTFSITHFMRRRYAERMNLKYLSRFVAHVR